MLIAHNFQFITLPDSISDTFTHLAIVCILFHRKSFKPRHEKNVVLPMRKQRRRSASR